MPQRWPIIIVSDVSSFSTKVTHFHVVLASSPTSELNDGVRNKSSYSDTSRHYSLVQTAGHNLIFSTSRVKLDGSFVV